MPNGLYCFARSLGPPPVEDPFPDVDGCSREIRGLKHHMLRVARDRDVTVLILGESGTGKERVARAIHRASPRHSSPFVVVNCAGLSPALAEDELFGHVRGAFTGAIGDRPGPFERANGGTVFLDEVGDLTPDLQMKLLRALQERTVQRLGGRQETAFDVRVIAATNADLALAASRGRFREDLYYRLKVYELRVPPLRRRGPTDLRALVHAILRRFAERRGHGLKTVAEDVMELFVHHRWPGNVRELENALERMVVSAGDERSLTREHLPENFGVPRPDWILGDTGGRAEWVEPKRLPSADEVHRALAQHAFSRQRAAAALGLSRHQLYRLLKRFGDPSSPDGT